MSPFPLIRAMRPHQWVKNIFVLAAISFGEAEAPDFALKAAYAFGAFCLAASAVYLLNDVVDVEKDRAHPEKRHRPIAAGELSISTALVGSALCALAGLFLARQAGFAERGEAWHVAFVLGCYMLLNLAYSLRLKRVVLLDAFCIAGGFLFRVKAGALAVGVIVSPWLFLCTLFLALFLALCKRRAESDLLGAERGAHRSILEDYTLAFLDQMVTLLAACTIIGYSMYTVSAQGEATFGPENRLFWTVPFVVFGLGRYLLLVQTRQGGGSPTRVLLGGDLTFVANGVAWLAAMLWLRMQA
ncbi:MAG TPA: decaprenyl-phosphate phosphoribosyltransferase [Planctomycetota bacterium]|jgi:4-hydroxybenzoate polyprenyltransferase|nr:decaprenyl-phosphate phosphoribosyltransferase [Planctomycetota bacterium]